MYSIVTDNINIGFKQAIDLIKEEGVTEDSRNGPVLRLPAPILIEHQDPLNRYLLSKRRDANPFFHLFELMWMLEGKNDLAPLLMYNPGMAQYSDDGTTLRGTAYGHRWRKHFGFDQLEDIITGLKADPTSRRYVMSMWDPQTDLKGAGTSKDLACNLQVIFSARAGDSKLLDMTVTNRSNDLIYGSLGSNVFHFSGLLEYVAWRAGMHVGKYYQFSTNLHVYTENEVAKRCLEEVDVNIPTSPDEWHNSSWFDRPDMDKTVDLMTLEQAYRTFKGMDHGPLPTDSKAKLGVRIQLMGQAYQMLEKVKHLPTRSATQKWMDRRLRKAEWKLENEAV